MAESDMKIVLEFLRSNGFSETESALKEDLTDKGGDLLSLYFKRFLFPTLDDDWRRSFSEDEFLSLDSFSTGEFKNHIMNFSSDSSSDVLSEFGTACDYHELDYGNAAYFQNVMDDYHSGSPEKRFNGHLAIDRLPTALDVTENDDSVNSLHKASSFQNPIFFDKSCVWNSTVSDKDNCEDLYQIYNPVSMEDRIKEDLVNHTSCYLEENINFDAETGVLHEQNFSKYPDINMREFNITENDHNLEDGDYDIRNDEKSSREPIDFDTAAFHEENVVINEPSFCDDEDECEVFNLKIIHRKNRTGFEESKDFHIVLNSMMVGRYYIKEHLGSAAFSKVVLAYDVHMGLDVCMKIIKNDKDCFDQSLDEVKLLKLVNKNDPYDESHILRLYDYFYFQEHLVIICELLGANLYEFQKFSQESGGEGYFTIGRLQLIAQQCLEAIGFLGNLGIIHCDVKPENILLKSYESCLIKLIDFGSSCFETDNLSLYVQSVSYRAPEVILGLPYDHKIDIWSLGCILAELCSGEVLFPNDTMVRVLARMMGMLGQFDKQMLQEGQFTNKYFTVDEYTLFHLNEETEEVEHIRIEECSLEDHLPRDAAFLHFITCLLRTNPLQRPTAIEALMHPWLSRPYPLLTSF